MKRFLIFSIIICLLLPLTLIGCQTQNPCYIEDDFSGLVIYGEKYVPIDLGDVRPVSSRDEGLGTLRTRSWNIFTPTLEPFYVNAEIPMLYVSTSELGENYFVPENQYESCLEYIQNLEWMDYLVLQYEQTLVLSPALAKHLLHDFSQSVSNITYRNERNQQGILCVAQYDTSGSFYRETGTVLIRAEGDCYYFPGGIDYEGRMISPEGEEYRQLTKRYEPLKISEEYWEELWKLLKLEDG
jgi:hypothetical protein